MIKHMAWNTFKNTGDINSYLEFAKMRNLEENLKMEQLDGDSENKGNSNF